ncbi:MAG: hypothetical protein L3J66_08230 [Bacteroidales bacterium]|nr:hypothetical protein [Bacteroidales bacterium]
MRELSLIVLLFVSLFNPSSDSSHGKNFNLSCEDCHTSEGWKVDKNNISFDHNITDFPLQGTHRDVNCTSCHSSLVFSEAEPECMSCHTDMHEQTVGFDCERCHNTNSWIVEDITELHQHSRFPLLGGHITADCYDCHLTASLLRFDPVGVECVDCHRDNYLATTSPNHVESDYSTDCAICHRMNAFSWSGADFAHTTFPLTQGHAINDCAECHKDPNDYSNISSECFACHETNYFATTNPNHQQVGLSTDCLECHTTNPGWKPAAFTAHDNLYFPIYSGEHNGEWNDCVDCHTNPDNYALFTCTTSQCHEKNDMDDEHKGVGGYIYESIACLDCHPNGSGDGFNHNTSAFPLTGAHTDAECENCHADGYSGTSTVCVDCHNANYTETTNPNHVGIGLSDDCESCHTTDPGWQPATFNNHNDYYALTGAHTTIANDCANCHHGDYNNTANTCTGCHEENYNQTTNPNHLAIGLSNDCEACHTTQAGWQPATFNNHNDYYQLNGAHASIANNCIDCHEGNYNSTPNTCVGCHLEDYNQTNDPPHASAQFSTDCVLCHTESVWKPSTFDHDGQYFPIYSGEHNGEWDVCADCHTVPSDYSLFSCIDCHEHNKADTDGEHNGVSGYVYNSIACLDCHPTGSEDFGKTHNQFKIR